MASISRLSEKLNSTNTGLVLFDTLNGYLHSGIPEKEKLVQEFRRNALKGLKKIVSRKKLLLYDF